MKKWTAFFQNLKHLIGESHPVKLVILGYLFYILAGWMVLLLPICQTVFIHPLDNLFTATSAVSTTGLTTITVGDSYSWIGQFAIMILMQLGGIGYSTFASFIALYTTKKLSKFQENVFAHSFSLPKGFVVHEFIQHVVIYSFVCEAIGAVLLSFLFKEAGVPNYIWNGIFHSVSAFCTAGFSLFSTNFAGYAHNIPVNLVLSVLSVLGAVGFIVWMDLFKRITGQKEHTTFTTRIILLVTFSFLLFGTALFFFTTSFPSDFSLSEKLTTAFFQTMSASTTVGFNTLDIGTLSSAALTLLLFLMAFGASPAGTGGGLKSTTFIALLALVRTTLRGKGDPISFWGHPIPASRMRIASATFTYYIFILVTSLFLLTLLQNEPFLPLLFEASSALSTVGLSMGETTSLSDLGKGFIILCMFMGRVGILSFGIAFLFPNKIQEVGKEDEHDLIF